MSLSDIPLYRPTPSDERAVNLSKLTVFKCAKCVYFQFNGMNTSGCKKELDHENNRQVAYVDAFSLEDAGIKKDPPGVDA
jgi:hypothetical protein